MPSTVYVATKCSLLLLLLCCSAIKWNFSGLFTLVKEDIWQRSIYIQAVIVNAITNHSWKRSQEALTAAFGQISTWPDSSGLSVTYYCLFRVFFGSVFQYLNHLVFLFMPVKIYSAFSLCIHFLLSSFFLVGGIAEDI